MVKPLFETNSSEKKEQIVALPLQFQDLPLQFPETPVESKVSTAISIPAPLFGKQDKDNRTLVEKSCKRIAEINVQLYEENSEYCASQCHLLFPLLVGVIVDYGNKDLGRMRITSNEVSRNVNIVTQTRCNEYVEETIKKLTGKQSWFSGIFTSKTDWIIKFEAHLSSISQTFSTVLPVIDDLAIDMRQHNLKLVLKLVVLTAISDVVGVIPDPLLDTTLQSRKVILQQSVTQSQLLIQELVSTKRYIVTQKQQIDQIINVTIPMFNSSRNNT